MNCIWETVLQAKKNGYTQEKLRFINAKSPSPYAECSFELLNTDSIDGVEIEINPLYRFSQQLGELFLEDVKGHEALRDIFLDIIMHYIAVWDLRSGYDRKEYQALYILREIEEGTYYQFARKALSSCSFSKAKRLMFYLLNLYTHGDYITEFKRALHELYPKASMYISNENNRRVILYVGEKESEEDRERLDMLFSIFLPLSYQVDIFWEKHFAVIGVEPSMKLGEIALY